MQSVQVDTHRQKSSLVTTVTIGKMGASQSALESFQDPGPAVTEERMLRALKKFEKTENVELVAIERLSENEKGEGFTSTLETIKVKALVNGQNKSYDWVVKSLPRDPNRALMSLAYKADAKVCTSMFMIIFYVYAGIN